MTAQGGRAVPLPKLPQEPVPGPPGLAPLTTSQHAVQMPWAVERRWRQEPMARWTLPRRSRSGWHAYRTDAGALIPGWAVELALTIEWPLASSGDAPAPQGLLLARAGGPCQPLVHALGTAMREVDSIAGVGPPLPRLHLAPSNPEPGLDPLPRQVVLAHLRGASERGLALGYRRRRTHDAGVPAWQSGAGVVLTCIGRAGVSAQAVVALAGHSGLQSLPPPPGGATVFRAWRCQRAWKPRGPLTEPDTEWALTAGVVLASSSGSGLGRVARRYAVQAREAGWSATVLTGAAALGLARAGDPRYLAPRATARHASRDAVTEMLTTCLAAAAEQPGDPAPSGN